MKRTCKRCNGTGSRNTPVVHLGVPGLCYGCDGAGTQVRVPVATLQAAERAGIARHRAELEELARNAEAAYADRASRRRTRKELDAYRAGHGATPVTDARWEEVLARYAAQDARHAAELESLRDRWRRAADVKLSTRAKWCSPRAAAQYPQP